MNGKSDSAIPSPMFSKMTLTALVQANRDDLHMAATRGMFNSVLQQVSRHLHESSPLAMTLSVPASASVPRGGSWPQFAPTESHGALDRGSKVNLSQTKRTRARGRGRLGEQAVNDLGQEQSLFLQGLEDLFGGR